MAAAEGMSAGPGDEERTPPPRDIDLSNHERGVLLEACAQVFHTQQSADRALERIGFERSRRPPFSGRVPLDVWEDIFLELDNGILPGGLPYWRLLDHAIRVYPTHRTLRSLAQRHGLVAPDPLGESVAPAATAEPERPRNSGPVESAAGAAAPPDACHLIVRVDGEEARERARNTLVELGLQPREVWSTANAVSYRLDTTDVPGTRRRLDETSLGWTLVAPGEPDYLIHSLYVSGPDGRRWRIEDAPAQQTVGNIATEVVGQYPSGFADATRPAVVDHIGRSGERRRLRSEQTLHDAGVQDGDSLGVGIQATAGVNPLDRQDALFRVRNELQEYAQAHTGFMVAADSALLPMRYRVSFSTPSWAPPAVPGGDPLLVSRHVVEIALGPEFPNEPPRVTWRSPILHPNVAPMYDTPQRQVKKELQGLVCLGLLAESYQPSLPFGVLCQILVDLAGYRNYSLVERRTDPDGSEIVVPNVYDAVAKKWVEDNPGRILQIGGVHPDLVDPRSNGDGTHHRYPNVIEPLR